MKKKLLLIIPIVFVLLLVLLLIYWNPRTTPISITLDAVKIDRNCNQIKTVPIELTGEWIHPWFEEKRLDITSNTFDGLSKLELSSSTTDLFPGDAPEQLPDVPLLLCYGVMFHQAKNQYEFCEVVFSPDYERWMLAFRKDNVFYVGSINSADTTEDLHEYFLPMIIGSWSGDPYAKLQYFGRWVTSDGNDKNTVDLVLNTKVQKNEDGRDTLTLGFKLPKDFPYTFTNDEIYYNYSNDLLPYYTSSGYTYGKTTNKPEMVQFAYDKEKNWSIFVWENNPDEYLLVTGNPQFDSKEVIEHFKVFLDLLYDK